MMRTYIITLSIVFQKSHNRAGEPTDFEGKLRKEKLHTIRANYPLWRERFSQIENDRACLSVRQWTGLPYRSKQVEIARLTKDDGIGIERLFIRKGLVGETALVANVDGIPIGAAELAANDGLSLGDWLDWFKDYDTAQPLAIIHFTDFRYDKGEET